MVDRPTNVPTADIPASGVVASLVPSLAEKEQKRVTPPLPTLDDIIFNNVAPPPEAKIYSRTLESARGGNKAAQQDIARSMSIYAAGRRTSEAATYIPGTEVLPTGERVTKLPESIGPRVSAVLEQEYIDPRTHFDNYLSSIIPDKNTRQLFINDFDSGNIFTETERIIGNAVPGFVQGVGPFALYAGNAIKAGVSSAAESLLTLSPLDAVENFSKSFSKTMPSVEAMAQKWRQVVRDDIGIGSYAERLNETYKQKYIDLYGQEAYDTNFVREQDGQKFELPIVNDDIAEKLLEFQYSGLSLPERFIKNVGIETTLVKPFAFLRLGKGASDFAKWGAVAKKYPELADLPAAVALRRAKVMDASNFATKGYYKFTNIIGGIFDSEGAVGTFLMNKAAANNFKAVNNRIDDLNTQINNLQTAKLSASPSAIKDIDQQLRVLDGQLGRANSTLANIRARGASDPYSFNTNVDTVLIASGQTIGEEYLAPLYDLERETGGLIGALATAVMGRPSVKLTGKLLKYGDDTLLKAAGQRSFGFVFDQFDKLANYTVGIPRGTFVDLNIRDYIEKVLPENANTAQRNEAIIAYRTLSDLFGGIGNATDEAGKRYKEDLFDALVDYRNTKQTILDYAKNLNIPDNVRDNVLTDLEAFFKLSFAQQANIAPLKALERTGLKSFSLKSLTAAFGQQQLLERQYKATNLGLQVFSQRMTELGISVDDGSDLAKFINNLKQSNGRSFGLKSLHAFKESKGFKMK